jgi:hypothetical protein
MPAMLTDPAILNHPHDYVWTDVYEVTLPPSDVMLTWDYRSPYPGSAEASEYFSVRLTEPERSFHPPAMLFQDAGRWTAILHSDNAQDLREQAATAKLPLDLRAWRMMKQDGKMEALNLLDRRQTFDLVFDAVSFEKVRRVEARVDGRRVKDLEIGAGPSEYRLEGFVLEPGARAILTFHATGGPSKVPDDQGGTRDATIAFHNFRVMSRP